MLIARRNLMSGGPTARDYVHDGLIAMWDGIENAGWGVHDPNATVWKDLVGSRDFNIESGGTVLSNHLSCDGVSTAASCPSPFVYSQILGLEIVFSLTRSPSAGATVANFADGAAVGTSYNMITRGVYANSSSAPYLVGAGFYPANASPGWRNVLGKTVVMQASYSGLNVSRLDVDGDQITYDPCDRCGVQ